MSTNKQDDDSDDSEDENEEEEKDDSETGNAAQVRTLNISLTVLLTISTKTY